LPPNCADASFSAGFAAATFLLLAKRSQKLSNGRNGLIYQCGRFTLAVRQMHEVSIMAEALRMAVDAAQSAGASRVRKLRLRIGSLSGVVPESMHFAFDVVCQNTMADGARLEIEAVPAACWCATCQAEFECADFFNECPRCRNVSGELRRGRELEIAAVELE
jgi:hydrogenase nickel incorporation protein HypA/HybF